MSSDERRIILVGKTGNGKSSTGNTLLGREAFTHRRGLGPVTAKSTRVDHYNPSTRWQVAVADTPGLFDAGSSMVDRALEIQRSVEICPKPHAFLLVFSATNRFTEEENYTIDVLRVIFGEKFFEHCIIVFTSGDVVKDNEEFKKEFLSSPLIEELLKLCKNRVIRIENSGNINDERRKLSSFQIIEMINQMSGNGKKTYAYTKIGIHKLTLIEHQTHEKRTGQLKDLLSSISEALFTKLGPTLWDKCLAAAKFVGLAAGGVVGIAGAAAGVAVLVIKLL